MNYYLEQVLQKPVITEDDLIKYKIHLQDLDDDTLQALLYKAVGYAEDLILFEMESREE